MKKPHFPYYSKHVAPKISNLPKNKKKATKFRKFLQITLFILFALVLALGIYARFQHFLDNHVK